MKLRKTYGARFATYFLYYFAMMYPSVDKIELGNIVPTTSKRIMLQDYATSFHSSQRSDAKRNKTVSCRL